MRFIRFSIPTQICFGVDAVDMAGQFASPLGDRVLIVTEGEIMRDSGLLYRVQDLVERHVLGCIVFDDFSSTASSDLVDRAAGLAREAHCNLVIGLGGEHILNAAKAVALTAANRGSINDFLAGGEPAVPSLPLICIPTVPVNAISTSPVCFVTNDRTGELRTIELPTLVPAALLLDPAVAMALAPKYLAASGLEMLSYGIEAYISGSATPFSDAFAMSAVETVSANLKNVLADPDNDQHRTNLAMAGLLSAMSAASSSPGTCYALALCLNARYGAYRGILAGILLPHVMDFNLTATPARYLNIARALGENIGDITVVEAAIKAVEGVRRMMHDLNLPVRLSELEIPGTELTQIAHRALEFEYVHTVPRPVSSEDLLNILQSAL